MAEIELRARAANLTCPFCHGALLQGGLVWACSACETLHHRDCVAEYGKCTVRGCGEPFDAMNGVVFLASPPPAASWPAAVAAFAAALLLLGGGAYAFSRQVRSPLPAVAYPGPSAPRPTPAAPTRTAARLFPRASLRGPGGQVDFPLGRPAIVNVWLQGCADCMPAFEQWKALKGTRQRFPVVNVAYGSGSPEWAESYGVGESLVNDPGGASVVMPLGIGTFTTYVLEADGRIRWTGHPSAPGFVNELALAVDGLEAELR